MDSSSHSVNGTDSDFSRDVPFDIELGRMISRYLMKTATQGAVGRERSYDHPWQWCGNLGCYGNMTEEHGEEDFLIVEIQDRRPQ
ncbi:MAG: hypothetical protein ACLR6I_00725 [Waltera sp.]